MRPTVTSETEKIRVLRIIARMNVGGPAIQVSGLMRSLDKSQFDQKLITGFCEESESDYLYLVATDVEAKRIRGLGRSISLLNDISALFRIIKEIRRFRPHVVHTHTAKAGVLGRVASLLSGVHSFRVHTFHGHLLKGYFSPLITRAVVFVERTLARRTHILVAVGSQVRDDLIRAGIGVRAKYRVVAPGLIVSTPRDRKALLREFELSTNDFVVSFLGRLTEIKRPDRLLDCIDLALPRIPELICLVAGDGLLLETVRAEAQRRKLPIKFLGMRTDIENVLSISDTTILTSDNEGTPLSLIQAGMIGIPAISTNVGSVSEVIEDGHTGILVEPSADHLATSLVSLYRDSSRRLTMGAAAKEYCLERFSVDRLARDYGNIYFECMSKSKED